MPLIAPDLTRVTLRHGDIKDYQWRAVEHILDLRFCAIFLGGGMGKTVISLTAIDTLLWQDEISRVLVVAPLKVANTVWPYEPGEWDHLAYLGCNLATGAQEDRVRALKGPYPITVINQENVAWLVAYWGADWPYDMVVWDESSRLKDHKSRGFEAAKTFRNRDKLRYFVELTATPARQSYMYLFSQTWLIDKGERLGSVITPFQKRFFTQNAYSHSWELRPGAAEEIEERIADIALVMQRKDYFTDPVPIIAPYFVDMTPSERERYKVMQREFVMEMDDGAFIEAVNSGVLSGKLLQLASGAVYDTEREWHLFHDHKLEAMAEIHRQAAGSPLLVSYWFKSSLERLRKLLPKAKVMDAKGSQEPAWNQGRIDVLLVHPQSAAHGLNLQKGPGHTLVPFDQFHSGELWQQLMWRLDRPGQRNRVSVRPIVTRKTLDEYAYAKQGEMDHMEQRFFQRLRALRAAKVKPDASDL